LVEKLFFEFFIFEISESHKIRTNAKIKIQKCFKQKFLEGKRKRGESFRTPFLILNFGNCIILKFKTEND